MEPRELANVRADELAEMAGLQGIRFPRQLNLMAAEVG